MLAQVLSKLANPEYQEYLATDFFGMAPINSSGAADFDGSSGQPGPKANAAGQAGSASAPGRSSGQPGPKANAAGKAGSASAPGHLPPLDDANANMEEDPQDQEEAEEATKSTPTKKGKSVDDLLAATGQDLITARQ